MTNLFRSGSFGFGTSVSGYSDVDYFAVFPSARLKVDSTASLSEITATLRTRFPNTGVKVDSPAVQVPFGTSRSERHEIIPAHLTGKSRSGHSLYGIPNRIGGWMHASPDSHAAWVDAANVKLNHKVKSLIRLAKAWKYYCNVPIRSFYLEVRVTEYALTQKTIIEKWDMRGLLNHLVEANLSNTTDPAALPDVVYPCFTTEFADAHNKLTAALASANTALNEETAGRMQSAFTHWDRLFGGQFPAYY